MVGGVDPQSGYQQRKPELDIPLLQTEDVQFEATFSELTLTKGPSTQSSYTKPSSEPAFTEPTYTKIPPPQAPLTHNHAPWMDLFAQINSLGTRMKELVVVNDTHFYSMDDRMDQYQAGFTSQFEYLQQRIERIKDLLECQHEKMMAYLRSIFPPLPHQH